MTDSQILWDTDTPIADLDGFDVPSWIGDKIPPADVAAIVQGGCDSGAWMPAVTYYLANETMHKDGDDVLQFIDDALGNLPPPPEGCSWSGMACHYLSYAVELWALGIEEELAEALEELAEEGGTE